MGMEISFTYTIEDKSRFKTLELIGAYFVDLFEAPDIFVHTGAFGGNLESVKEAGFFTLFRRALSRDNGFEYQMGF